MLTWRVRRNLSRKIKDKEKQAQIASVASNRSELRDPKAKAQEFHLNQKLRRQSKSRKLKEARAKGKISRVNHTWVENQLPKKR